jgi:uncharacterized protein
MQSRLMSESDERIYTMIFDPGEEAIEGLRALTLKEEIGTASFTAIGGFQEVKLGFFNLETRGFDEIPFEADQVEVLSLMGEITRDGDEPNVHGHVVVGRRDGSTAGGHLLRGVVRPILIVTVTESEASVPHH